MLGDWSTRYLPGGMLAVAQPRGACSPTPNTPLLPYVIGSACAGAAATSPASSTAAVATVSSPVTCLPSPHPYVVDQHLGRLEGPEGGIAAAGTADREVEDGVQQVVRGVERPHSVDGHRG